MKRPFQATLATLLLAQLCTGAALADGIKVIPNGDQASMAGPADYFTGAVVVDMLFTPTEYSQVSGAHVTFAPGARTAWHTYPRGQTLSFPNKWSAIGTLLERFPSTECKRYIRQCGYGRSDKNAPVEGRNISLNTSSRSKARARPMAPMATENSSAYWP
ncbi:hypothetical protein SAMN04244572_03797, partial [Azotobacter beijerinckii]